MVPRSAWSPRSLLECNISNLIPHLQIISAFDKIWAVRGANVTVLEKEPAANEWTHWQHSTEELAPSLALLYSLSGPLQMCGKEFPRPSASACLFSVSTIHQLRKCQKSRSLGTAQTWIGNSMNWAQPSSLSENFWGSWCTSMKTTGLWDMKHEWSGFHGSDHILTTPISFSSWPSTLGPGSADTSMGPRTHRAQLFLTWYSDEVEEIHF